ncbi:MAG: J domain-containing protein [Novosphingobium sp.]|nr:J domain-containing protein [Novosphingobium sp.]MCP5403190.1 J domain-containing protein [Novosphingobium sp.]
MKFLWLLVLAVIAWRVFFGRWPWQPGRKGMRARARAQARSVLGVGEAAGRDEIIEAHRRLLVKVHPDRGGSNEQVHEANAARDLLLGDLALGEMEQS